MTLDKRGELLDYAAIRARISLIDVLALLNYRPRRTHTDCCRGRCPLHENHQPDSQSTCFSAHLQRNIFKCFACGAQGNQLDLWRLHSGLPLYEATLQLCRRAGVHPPRLPASATHKSPADDPQPVKNEPPAYRQTGPIPDRH